MTAVILDRHPLWLDALEDVLEEAGIDVVVKTTSPDQALAAVSEAQAALFVSEYEALLGGMDGMGALRRLTRQHPDLRIVVLGATEDPSSIAAAFAAGASAYCAKAVERSALAAAVHQAFHESVYLAHTPRGERQPVSSPAEAARKAGLTRREIEILRLVAEGHLNSQIAKMLWVTEQTIKFHLSNVYRKLEVANRTGAARWAQLHGLLSAEPHEMTAA